MSHRHAVVWVDHAEAHVLFVGAEDLEKEVVASAEHPRLHHRRGAVGPGRSAEDSHFYQGIADALGDTREILITGPGQAKLELFKHLQQQVPAVAARVVGLESADHPTDAQLAAHARRYFRAKDRMLGDAPERAPSPPPSGGHARKTSSTHGSDSSNAPRHRR